MCRHEAAGLISVHEAAGLISVHDDHRFEQRALTGASVWIILKFHSEQIKGPKDSLDIGRLQSRTRESIDFRARLFF